MASHKHGFLHRILHYIEELFEITGELLVELWKLPKGGHHGTSWWYFWGSALIAAGFGMYYYVKQIDLPISPLWAQVYTLLYTWYPVWLPLFLFRLWYDLWMKYIRLDFMQRNPGVLLEIRIPKEIEKTPRSMELLIMALYETGAVELNETYWMGKIRPWWSFEIVSIEGDVHFYVWCFPKYRNILESQIYAQYPTVEIVEAEDYSKKFVFDPPNKHLWGTYFILQKPDPYPIMTYVDYGLDKETEEEYKVDPLSSLLEYLGSMKKGEQIWIQILTQAYKKRGYIEGMWLKEKDWLEECKEEINSIMKRDPKSKSTRQFTEVGYPVVPTLTEWEKKQVEAIERSMNKRAFWVTVRAMYSAEPQAFHLISPSTSGLLGTFRKPFNSNLLNGFKLGWYTDIRDMTKDIYFVLGGRKLYTKMIKIWVAKYAKLMLDAYRRRSIFYPPYSNWRTKPYIMTAEELATVFHFPGMVVTTPTFERIPSKKVEPPANLPI